MVAGVLVFLAADVARSAIAQPTAKTDFRTGIAPLLVEHCVACHRPDNRKGNYDLSTGERLFKGRREQVVVAGKPEESKLYLMLTGEATPVMPKDAQRLRSERIALIEQWIRDGAKLGSVDPKTDIRSLVPNSAPKSGARKTGRLAPVNALAFVPDGSRLFIGAADAIVVVDSKSLKQARVIDIEAPVHAFAFPPGGKHFLAAGGVPGRSGSVEFRDLSTMAVTRKSADSTDVVHAVSASANQVAAGGMERVVRYWPKAVDTKPTNLEPVSDAAFDLAFTPNGKSLLVASRDKSVKVWDLQTKETSAVFSGHQDAAYAVVGLPGNELAASASADGSVRIWATGSAKEKAVNNSFGKPLTRLVVDSAGKSLFVGGADGIVAELRATDLKLVRSYVGQKDWVFALALSPDGSQLAAGGWDGFVRIWNTRTGQLIRQAECRR